MILCLDVGNTHIFGGVFAQDKIQLRFRHNTYQGSTSDQLGVFLKNVLRENSIDAKLIQSIGICSVVPSIDYSLKAACIKYFQLDPFILQVGVKTGIKIKTASPNEIGADLIAGAIAATHAYPQKNLIVLDCGTITTLAVINKNKEFLGAIFFPGMRTAMQSLQTSAAKLFTVEILKPKHGLGRTSCESMQSGLFFGHIGAIKECINKIIQEAFSTEPPLVIASGGFSQLFEQENIFDHIDADLVLHGIKLALELNK